MQRVMIIGQPGSGKSTLARALGQAARLPVIHIDHIHWKPGWQERARDEKTAMCLEVQARPEWVFEGGHSTTWADRAARADTVIWLDLPLWLRGWRVLKRTLRYYGRSRPDLPENCPEHFSLEFYRFIWTTRQSWQIKAQALIDGLGDDKTVYHLKSPRQVRAFMANMRAALAQGNLGRPHR